MTDNPPRHFHEISITATDSHGNEHTEHLELATYHADTPEKAAKVVSGVLAANCNGGVAKFTRPEHDR